MDVRRYYNDKLQYDITTGSREDAEIPSKNPKIEGGTKGGTLLGTTPSSRKPSVYQGSEGVVK